MKSLEMKDVQKISIDILNKVSDICEQLNLRYYLAYGSLIGAVRHAGYIPWDDDLDIWMPKPDYDKLEKYFLEHEKELFPLKIFTHNNNLDYPYMINRISNCDYVINTANEKDCGMGVFIDIYPLNGMGNDKGKAVNLRKKTYKYSSLCFLSTRLKCEKGLTKNKFKRIIKFPAFIFAKSLGKNFFFNKLEKYEKLYSYNNSKYVGPLVWNPYIEKDVFEKQWFGTPVKIKFENSEFYVPEKADLILSQIYGNYMELPPEKDRIPHHFYTVLKK